MRDIPLVKVVYAKYNLLPQILGLDFCHLSIWLAFQVAVKGAAVDVFHDEEDLLVRLERFEELGEALMIDFLHNLDLPLDTLPAIGLQQFELLVDFDGDLLIQDFVKTDSDNGVGTLANPLADNVIVNIFDVAALGTELILLVLALLARGLVVLLLVFLDMVCEGMSLGQMSRLILVLLLLNYMLMDEFLAPAQLHNLLFCLVCIPLVVHLSLSRLVHGAILAIGIDYSSGLPGLQLPVLVLDVL